MALYLDTLGVTIGHPNSMIGSLHNGVPGPRDWSPAIDQAKEKLKSLKAWIPKRVRASREELRRAGFSIFEDLEESGLLLILKIPILGIGQSYHAVYVTARGEILMGQNMKNYLDWL